jgi:VCBS repeat-containing protein
MKKHRPSLIGRTFTELRNLFGSPRKQRRDRLDRFRFESLESRYLMAGDLDLGEGEGTAPTLAAISNATVLSGSPLWIPLDGEDVDGGQLTYEVSSDNPNVQVSVPTGNRAMTVSVAGFGDMTFQLFDHLVPRVTSRIANLALAGFYNDTADNTVTFHRVINNFMIQTGDPGGLGRGGSPLPDFDDQFHFDLQHNRSGLLSMAKSSDDTNNSQFFVTASPQRHLDFNHSIFGILTEGDSVRAAINAVSTGAQDKPNTDVVVSSVNVSNDLENGALLIKPINGITSGTANITVTIRDAQNNTATRTFQVTVQGDSTNGSPFLSDIPQVRTTVDQQKQFTLQGNDVEGSNMFFGAAKPSGSPNYTFTIGETSGVVSVTPPAGAIGTFDLLVGVSGSSNLNEPLDLQTVKVFVDPTGSAGTTAPAGIDLPDAFDSGTFNNDNVTNVTNFRFTVSGVTAGAVVKLYNGTTLLGSVTAPGTTVDFDTNHSSLQTDGTYSITATQTIGGQESILSSALEVEVDRTAPVAFTSTPATSGTFGVSYSYNAEHNEEGTTGFRYSPGAVPAGVTVNPITGVVAWTPTAGQGGQNAFTLQARDRAGNLRTQGFVVTVNVPSGPSAVDLLAASDLGGSPTDNITNATSLQFEVQGVTNGAVVKLYKGATLLGQATASGSTVTIPISTLGEGTHSITATQTVTGVESPATPALSVTIDLTAPGAFTSTPPAEATVGELLSYDANAPGEGTANFKYSLSGAPSGVTINDATGVLSWTPNFEQLGNQTFGIVFADAAGNVNTQTVNVEVDEAVPAKIELTLVLTKPDGSPLSSLDVGEDFVLHAYVEDVRDVPKGIAGTYFDITYDSARAETTGTLQFNTGFWVNLPGLTSGSIATPGLIDEVGSFYNVLQLGTVPTPPFDPANGDDPYKVRLFSLNMRSKTAGPLLFESNAADDTVNHPSVMIPGGAGSTVDLATEIRYGTAGITVAATFEAANDTFNVNEDAQNFTLNPLANEIIEPGSGNVLTITGVGSRDKGGSVQVAGDGKSLLYTPAANFNGTETFTYTVTNQLGETSTATITVQVQPQNDPPDAVNDGSEASPVAVPEDSENFAIAVLANDTVGVDTDESPTTLKVTGVTQGAHGTVTIGPGGNSVLYKPNPNYIGTDSFTYTISDRTTGGLSDTATVFVNVTEANDNPTAVNDLFTITEDNTLDDINDNIINVLGNDSFAPDTGETLTVTGVSNVRPGATVTVGTGGANVVYSPAPNFQGTDTFSYTISDGRGGTATGIVTVTVTNSNDPPTANADSVTAFRNTAATFDVLANDSSAPDPAETLTIEAVTQGNNGGSVQITNGGTRISYTPANNFTGTETFTYTIRDPSGAVSQSATVTVNVQQFVPSSLAGFVYFDVDNDGVKDASESPIAGVTITLTGTDVNSTAVNRTLKTGPDGSYKFDTLAPGNYTLTQSQPAFTMDGKDTAGSQGGNTSTNNRIVIANLAQNTNGTNNNFGERGRELSLIKLADFYSSNSRDYAMAAVDTSGNQLWYSSMGSPPSGIEVSKYSLQSSGAQLKIEGKNAQNQDVAATLSTSSSLVELLGSAGSNRLYRIDAEPAPTFAVVPNQAPVAAADTYSTAEDTPLTISGSGVLGNDSDPNGHILTAAVVAQPQHGTLALNANGTFTYTPAANYNGPDSFTYRANDGSLNSNTATVSITVNAVNDAPVADNDSFSATEDTPFTAPAPGVLDGDTDPDGASVTLTPTIVTQPASGSVTMNANGSFTYTPPTDFNGTVTFTYRVSDGSLNSNTATVTINVAAVEGEGEGEGSDELDALLAESLWDENAVDAVLAELAAD